MPRQKSQLEVNNFTQGIITEASPLTFPPNASIDEKNFEMKRGGLRQRRLGMDYETDYQVFTVEPTVPASGNIAFQSFDWDNVGGDADFQILVLQFGDTLVFFNNNGSAVSEQRLNINALGFPDHYDVTGADPEQEMSFASIDGTLVMTCGLEDVYIFEYDASTQRVGASTRRLKIRDIFGVEDTNTIGLDTVDLLDDEYVSYQVANADITDLHLYNLNNQGWGNRIFPDDTLRSVSPLGTYDLNDTYPSNSQVVWSGVQFNTSTPPQRKFYHLISQNDDYSRSAAAKGYFIIDALDRGASREAAYQNNIDIFSLPTGGGAGTADHPTITSLPADQSPGGPKVVAEFAGRVFYAGFSGDVTDGDARSPKLSSYIMFSQLVNDPKQITKCYQKGDPTSDVESDLVATDGGLIKIEGAYNINRLIPIGEFLVVMAENGIWAIRGDTGIGFSATAYEVLRVSSHGTDSPLSAVEVDNTVLYFGIDAIYQVGKNQYGELAATNLSSNTIQELYEGIGTNERRKAIGFFDSYARKVRWLYNNQLASVDEPSELIFDVELGAFTRNEITRANGTYPLLASIFEVPPYNIAEVSENVEAAGVEVEVLTDQVVVTSPVRESALAETKYLCITAEAAGVYSFTFSLYKDNQFLDWETFDGTGVDADAFIITGHITGGDTMRFKQVPTLVSHLRKTETGFTTNGSGDLVPVNQSSCKLQVRWDWSNSANSNRWGREVELYQFKRHYIPPDTSDTFDNGYETVVSRRRLRGKGKAMSFKFSTSPGKDCRLIGWGLDLTVQGRA